VDEIWQRADQIEVGGHAVRYLAAGDELRYLSYHYAAQHRGDRLIWLVDIARLVRSLGAGWNWGGFVRETVALGLATPVAAALGRAHQTLDLEIPARVLAELQQAAAEPQERAAWNAALTSFHRLDTALRYVLAQRRPIERLAFLRAGIGRASRRWAMQARGRTHGDARALPPTGASVGSVGVLLGTLLEAGAEDQAESVSALYYAARARRSTGYAVAKRSLDVCLSLIALILLAPIMAAIALAIKLGDGGPVLYPREMIGESGMLFRMYKFRTMQVHAERLLATNPALYEQFRRENFKLRDDPRVTRVGRSLRRYSFDELPQLWNILRGEMSLVGPRCIHPSELALYGEYAWVRHCVRPGLTGLWQISGRSDRTYRERVRLDLEYLLTCSLRQDIAVLARTVPVVLRGAGAY
jgi:lipopolysaccharide/colanic/teichoic acid biosynthesis glycosyltransferase